MWSRFWREQYTTAYRREAARLVMDTGRPVVPVSHEIGVGEALLDRWVAQRQGDFRAPRSAPKPQVRLKMARRQRWVDLYAAMTEVEGAAEGSDVNLVR